MRMLNRVSMCTLLVLGSVLLADIASAQQVQPGDLGVVQAPAAGSIPVPLKQVPLPIRHSAEVAFKLYEGGATLVSAQVDKDEVLAVHEMVGQSGGRRLEADVRADGFVLELEIEVGEGQVPAAVMQALGRFAPTFSPATSRPRIEKSARPSEIGLPEIWYEFSGTMFDIEIRTSGSAMLIEPA